MNLKTILSSTKKNLAALTENAQQEAELLLSHVLKKSRSYLHTYPELKITTQQQQQIAQLLNRRLKHEPLPYILQQHSFYNIDLQLTQNVLIPRSDTELLIEIILEQYDLNKKIMLADLGTGSGAIALSLANAAKNWQLIATDISAAALQVAKQNANNLQLKNVQFYLGDWCCALPEKKLFDVIVSNPPYIAKDDAHLSQPELKFEPQLALVAGDTGLDAITAIISTAATHLKPHGMLLLEHGYNQAKKVRALLRAAGFTKIKTFKDLGKHERATRGFKI